MDFILPLWFLLAFLLIPIFSSGFLVLGKAPGVWYLPFEITGVLVGPIVFLAFADSFGSVGVADPDYYCVRSTVFFAPAFRPTAYALLGISMLGYFFTRFPWLEKVGPVWQWVGLSSLVLGLGMGAAVLVHTNDAIFMYFGAVQVLFLYLAQLRAVWIKIIHQARKGQTTSETLVGQGVLALLRTPIWHQLPFLLLSALALLASIAMVLFPFGQPLLAFVQAFTETYGLGWSQLSCSH